MTTVTVPNRQKFTVYADLKSIISLPIEAADENEAKEIAQHILYDHYINNIELNINRFDGGMVKPRVCDWDINVDDGEE